MGMKTFVFSRTLKKSSSADVIFVSDDAGEFVRRLKNEDGKDIWLMGGGVLAASLMKENLVDEIGLTIQPVLLGAGIPLFLGLEQQIDLQLLKCKAYENGLVGLTYRVKNVPQVVQPAEASIARNTKGNTQTGEET
jgi:dihydrofolate reductase